MKQNECQPACRACPRSQFYKMGHEGGLHTSRHVEQIVAAHITACDAGDGFVPGFLVLLLDLRQFDQTMKAADGLHNVQRIKIDPARNLRRELGYR